jgi:hypothetical protein
VITAEMVSERVIAAFEVDRRLPRVAGPKAPGGSHPTVFRSEDERREVAELRKLDRIEDEAPTVPPTRYEIAQADEAFEWMNAVARLDADAVKALHLWGRREAQPIKRKGAKSLRSIAADLGIKPMQITRLKNRAIDMIGSMLAYRLELNSTTIH